MTAQTMIAHATEKPEYGLSSPITCVTAQIARLVEDWTHRRAGRELPARADFDIQDLRYILGNLSLIHVAPDSQRFLFRVHGTKVASRVGYDLTGKSAADIPNERARDMVMDLFGLAIARRSPVVQIRQFPIVDTPIGRCETAALPLSGNGRTIDSLFGAVVWL